MAPKKNNQKMSLGDFLGDQTLGSWADEMEDMPLSSDARAGYGGGERRTFTAPSAGGMGERSFSSRGFAVREELPMPSKPPFTAHLANLSFDATEGDVQDFLQDCGVVSVRIVEDRLEHKPKGFGYVEFKTVDGLKTAIGKSGTDFLGRTIRLSVADPPKDRGEARELTDWTRKGPLPDLPQNQRRPSERGAGFERSFSRGYEAAPGMDAADRGARRQTPFNDAPPPPSRDLDWGARKGPLSPLSPQERPARDPASIRSNEGQQPPQERRNSPAWGEGTNRSQDGSRPPRGDRPPVERAPTQAEKDSQWRARMRPDSQKSPGSTPEASTPSSPAQPPPPATRPRLNLQKRTVSEAEPSGSAAASPGDSKASPFGAARPIDTSAREREVEEKRQLALRQKKEADDKARAERKAQAEKEKAEKMAAARDADPRQNGAPAAEEGAEGQTEAAADAEATGREETGEGEKGDVEEAQDAEGVDAPANGVIVDDKAVKPKEVTRDPPTGPRSSWRKGSAPNSDAAAATAGATAENLEEDGWSTVPTKARNTGHQATRGRGRGRGGHGGQGARAIAS